MSTIAVETALIMSATNNDIMMMVVPQTMAVNSFGLWSINLADANEEEYNHANRPSGREYD
jgi:hypothetical protein